MSVHWRKMIARWLGLVTLAGFLLFSQHAKAAVSYADMLVTDVTAASFVVLWRDNAAATGQLNVFSDALGSIPVTDAVITPQFITSNNPALQTQAASAGVLRLRVSNLKANTAYFFQTVTTAIVGGAVQTFPASGPYPSVITQLKAAPVSNESLGARVLQQDGATAASGSVMLVYGPASEYPVSHMVGDSFAPELATINLTNLFSNANRENLRMAGGEAIRVVAFGGINGDAAVDTVLPVNNSFGEVEILPQSPLVLSVRADTDLDGMPDSFELRYGLNINVNDAPDDADNDGLSNLDEYLRGTNPQLADTDGDGLSDNDEVTVFNTLPNVADSDRDGVTDGDEVGTYSTNPVVADSDGDGVNDGLEVGLGTDPNNPLDTPVLDDDSDGIPNSSDNCRYLPNPGQQDTDSDGLGNVCDPDDDNDGINDQLDNAPQLGNPGQEDQDLDGIGDVADNCPAISNSAQSDYDSDGLGDVCDADDDNDGVNDFTVPPPPSDQPFMLMNVTTWVNTSLPVTNNASAFVSVSKFDFDSGTLIRLGYFNLTTREFVIETLSPEQAVISGVLTVGLDINNCDCFAIRDGDTITLRGNTGDITIVFSDGAALPQGQVMFVSTDGSLYAQYFPSTRLLTTLLKSSHLPQKLDNCQFVYNPSQSDVDNDGIGDLCDVSAEDLDGDGVLNQYDNCPTMHNIDQSDIDGDGIGTVCDSDNDNDGLSDSYETTITFTNHLIADSDGDGIRDGDEDFDQDGRTNLSEVTTGSNPVQPDLAYDVGLNLISYPVLVPQNQTAFNFMQQLGGSSNVQKIMRLNESTGLWETAEYINATAMGVDFPILDDEGYFLVLNNSLSFTYSGNQVCTGIQLNPGVNVVGLTCVPQGTTAFGLLGALGGNSFVGSVQHYNKETGRFETATYQNGVPSGVDFPITNNAAYVVNMKTFLINSGFSGEVPSFTVNSHINNQIVNSASISLSGVISDANALLMINGQLANVTPISGGGTFSLLLNLVEGPNVITFNARGANNLTSQQTLTITRATPPAVTVQAPVEGRTVFGSPFTVGGSVSDPAAAVVINGVAATLTGNTYSADVPLTEGANTITITATGSNGAVTALTRNVTYAPIQVSVQAGGSTSGSLDILTTPEILSQMSAGYSWSVSRPSFLNYSGSALNLIAPSTVAIGYTVTAEATALPDVYDMRLTYNFSDTNSNQLFTESADFRVTVTAAAGPPVVAITSHSDGQTVNSTPVTISGTVSDTAATVMVNSQPVTMAGNTYSAVVDLVEGANTITVVATNSFGTATQTIGLVLNTTAVTPDVSLAAGASATGMHSYTPSVEIFNAFTLYYLPVITGMPAFLSYSTTGVTKTLPNLIRFNYQITATTDAVPGIYTFNVSYALTDGTSVIATEAFNLTVEVIP